MTDLLFFIMALIACAFFYWIDYSTAILVAKKDYAKFRQGELNKSLVWYYEQYMRTKNKAFFYQMHIQSLSNLVLFPVLFGWVGMQFGLDFYLAGYIFLIIQGISSIFGTLSNLISYFRLVFFHSEEKQYA